MRLVRVRGGEWLAGAAAVVLIVSLFLGWTSVALDVILAVLALVGIALLAAQATSDAPVLPAALSVLGVCAGAAATIIVAIELLTGTEGGAWLALAGALGLLAGAWWSMAAEQVRGMPMPEVRARPAPPPGG